MRFFVSLFSSTENLHMQMPRCLHVLAPRVRVSKQATYPFRFRPKQQYPGEPASPKPCRRTRKHTEIEAHNALVHSLNKKVHMAKKRTTSLCLGGGLLRSSLLWCSSLLSSRLCGLGDTASLGLGQGSVLVALEIRLETSTQETSIWCKQNIP